MGHAIDLTVKTDEQTELGDVLDLTFDDRVHREGVNEGRPGIIEALFEAQGNPALLRIRIEHHNLDFLAGGDDFARMNVLFRPAHFRDVNQAFDAGFEFHESTVIGDIGDPAGELGTLRILRGHAIPRISLKLLHAQRNTLGFSIETDHLDFNGLTDLQNLGGMINPLPGNIGNVQQAVDTAQINKCAVIGDVLDNAFQHLAFGQIGHQFGTRFGAGFFQHRTTRDNDVVALRVHLQNLERLRRTHQGRDVANRADIDLAARQECHGAGKIDNEAAFDPAEDNTIDALGGLEGLFQFRPGFLATRFFTAQADHPVAVFITLDENIDRVTDNDLRVAFGAEFLQRHAAFRFEADVNQRSIVIDGQHRALDDTTVKTVVA